MCAIFLGLNASFPSYMICKDIYQYIRICLSILSGLKGLYLTVFIWYSQIGWWGDWSLFCQLHLNQKLHTSFLTGDQLCHNTKSTDLHVNEVLNLFNEVQKKYFATLLQTNINRCHNPLLMLLNVTEYA